MARRYWILASTLVVLLAAAAVVTVSANVERNKVLWKPVQVSPPVGNPWDVGQTIRLKDLLNSAFPGRVLAGASFGTVSVTILEPNPNHAYADMSHICQLVFSSFPSASTIIFEVIEENTSPGPNGSRWGRGVVEATFERAKLPQLTDPSQFPKIATRYSVANHKELWQPAP